MLPPASAADLARMLAHAESYGIRVVKHDVSNQYIVLVRNASYSASREYEQAVRVAYGLALQMPRPASKPTPQPILPGVTPPLF